MKKKELEKKTDKLDELIADYQNKHKRTTVDRYGNVVDEYYDVNPILITNTFFRSDIPIDANPVYNAQEMSQKYQFYEYLITKINDEIGDFPSSLTLFCKLIGMSLKAFQELKQSPNEDLRNVVEKIYNDIEEYNITMSQLGKIKERTTLFKLKSQNEMVEKVQPRVNITVKKDLNYTKIKGNIDAYSNFVKKYGEKNEK